MSISYTVNTETLLILIDESKLCHGMFGDFFFPSEEICLMNKQDEHRKAL